MLTKTIYNLESNVLVKALLPLTVRDLSDVLLRAIEEPVINYWAHGMQATNSVDGSPTEIVLIEDHDLHSITLTVDRIRQTLEQILVTGMELNSQTRNSIRDAVSDQCLGYIDSDDVDAIIQLACFGYLKYA